MATGETSMQMLPSLLIALLVGAPLAGVIVMQQLHLQKMTEQWTRILSERLGIPAAIMENRPEVAAEPRPAPPPKPRVKLSIPLPVGPWSKRNTTLPHS